MFGSRQSDQTSCVKDGRDGDGRDEFDYGDLVNSMRCHTTEWLVAERDEAVREQRRLRVRELAITRVLDDRGVLDDSLAARDGVTLRVARETIETARALEALPEVAAVAHSGGLSSDQLTAVARLAEPGSDSEWARRAPNLAPDDLARLARNKEMPTAADGAARRRARDMAIWWQRDSGMLAFRGQLPDIDGALAESVLNQMIEQMRSAKGQPWETRGRRMADAFVELCRDYADVHAVSGPIPHLVVEVPLRGPAEIVGIPLPDAMVESLRARAKIEPVLVDDDGVPVVSGRTASALPPKTVRGVKLRDGKCRWPGCEQRSGLEVRHLWPRSWAGSDEQANLAALCVGGGSDHSGRLAPEGPYLLLGNPNQPDGLQVVLRSDLPRLVEQALREQVDPARTNDARAGPHAA